MSQCYIWHVALTFAPLLSSIYSSLSLLLNTHTHRKAFSLTRMHRNLYTGSSSAAGLLPQAETPRSPWQPCHSDGQRRGGVSRAAALSHRPPALIGSHCHRHRPHPHPSVVLHLLSCLFVCESAKCSRDSVPLAWKNLNHVVSPPWGF